MRRAVTVLTAAALVAASINVVLAPSASAVVPPPTGNNAVITVKVGSDRTGTAGVTSLAGVVLGLFDTAGATTPVAGFGTCTSDSDGDCSFTVPNTQPSGANRDRRFFVKQISAPGGYFANTNLAVGTTVASTAYSFQTGTQLRNGTTYSSQANFMIDTGNTNNVASGGIWQDSRNNPTLPAQCGLKVAIVADLSNSVGSDLVNLKGAATTFVNALTGTPSTVSLFTFATNSPATGANNINRAGLLPVSTAAGAATVNGFINGWSLPGGDNGGTNWDRAFAQVASETQHYDVVTVITDGNPTFYGDPVQGPGNRTRFREVENGIFSANAIKAEGSRLVAVGVGAGIAGAPDNLRAISGPVLNSDFYQTADYTAAGQALRALALGNCTGTISVVKQVLPPGTPPGSQAGAQPAGGWTFGAATSTGGVTITPTSGQTAVGTGALNFGLTFPGGTPSAPITLTETQQAGYTLHPVNGANAVCTRLDTGDSLPVTNAATGPGFTVDANEAYPVSCTVYNIAPQPPASVVVNKQWIVDGVTVPQGEQPAELNAALLLDGTAQDWSTPRTGFSAGNTVTINETTSVAATTLCTITNQRLTLANGTVVDLSLPSSQTLVGGINTYTVTNTVVCPSRLTLVKQVQGGTAPPTAWTLSATAPPGALTGPSGTTGVTAPVTPNVIYPLSESGGDPRYLQFLDNDAVSVPGSTGSWNCQQLAADGTTVVPGFQDGLNGGVTPPPGFWVRCTAVNQTSQLTLIKHVVNTHGGTATASDWTLTGTPSGTVPPGLSPVSVSGSEAGASAQVRPNQSYVLSESGPAGYVASAWTCTGGTLTGSTVVVPPGGEARCTIVNNDAGPTLTLVKQVNNGNTGATTPATAWTLTASGPTTISGVTGTPAVTGAVAQIGTYNLSETGPSGYTALAWTCTGAASNTATSVTLASGNNATCTIVNTAIAPKLTLVKQVTNTHGGTATPQDWTLTATNGDSVIIGVTGTPAVTGATAVVGTYTLGESGPTGYSASAWTCTGAASATASSVTLEPGQDATCTITNTDQPGHLTLRKIVDPAASGSGKTPADWTLTATPDGIPGQNPVSGNGADGVTDVEVFAGDYDLTESGPPGFEPGTWVCTGGAQTGATVTVPNGGDVTCTITNTAIPPRLTLVKIVDDGNTGATTPPTAWTLSATGPTTIEGVTGTSDVTNAAAQVGTYTLTESGGPGGYSASDWTCTGATATTATTVTLAEGDTASCTIMNTAVAPKLTLVKAVDSDDSGGTATPTDWTLTAVNGGSTITGTSGSGAVTGATAVVGTYALSESGGPTGYTASAWDCTGATGTTGSTVTLQPGDDATCTITNTAERPHLTLVKVVDNTAAGGTAEATAWTLTAVNGASTITGQTGSGDVTDAPAVVGTYSLSESDGPDGYTASDWDCTGATSNTADSVALALGDSATCTITNTAIPPTLTLVKTVDNGETGATHTAQEWTLSASGPVDISGATGAGAVTGATVKVGTYQLDEAGPAGYQTDGWTCVGAADNTPTSVTLGAGQSATCTITNTAFLPALTLVKEVHNEHGGTRQPADWTLGASGPVTISGHTGTAAVTAAQVPTGSYDLSESGPSGYNASAWKCVDGKVTGATVQVGLGAHVICTIVNTDIAAPPPPPPPPPLSFTGAEVMTWTKLAILLLLSGGVLLFVGRRRRWI